MQNLFWQIIAAWGAVTPLLMMTYLVWMGLWQRRMAARLSEPLDAPPVPQLSLRFLVSMWLLSLACAMFSLWCIFW